MAHLALFLTLSDELTLELRDDEREVGVRGVSGVGRCGGGGELRISVEGENKQVPAWRLVRTKRECKQFEEKGYQ